MSTTPVINTLASRITIAAANTHRSPSLAQKEVGNYPKGKFPWNGLEISIESPKGSIRKGTNRHGQDWSVQMPAHYGYIRRTLSKADGDAVDVIVGPHPESDLVFVVDQQSPSGRFDEHKSVIGCLNVNEARRLYLSCYSPGWTGLKSITPMTRQQFVMWLKSGNTGKPIARQVSQYSRIEAAAARATRYARETRPVPTPKSRDAHQPEPTPPISTSTSGNGKKTGNKSGWITVGGSHVHIGDDGKILSGCPGLKGEHVADLKNESQESRHVREVRQDHAEARGLTGHDVTASEARKLANAENIRQHTAAKQAAQGSGHSTASVLSAMSGAHEMETHDQQLFRPALNRLMRLTGLTPATARDWENKHEKDWSTWPGFDDFSRIVAGEHPELSMNRDDHDTPGKLWDLLRDEGKRTKAIEGFDPQVARTAVAMLGRPVRKQRQQRGAAADVSNSGGDTSFDPDRFSRAKYWAAQHIH